MMIKKPFLHGLLYAVLGLGSGTAGAQDYLAREEVQDFIQAASAERGFKPEFVRDILARAEYQQSILDAIRRPAEGKPWHEYRKIFIQDVRVREGVEFWLKNRELLEKASQQYGVPAEIIVAIIGVETRYGRYTGGYRVLDALMTLTFDYEKRHGFFREELTEFLALMRREGWQVDDIKGSYAGAMGMPQFMPSSYRKYAVDFDADGKINLFTDTADIIGSVAHYFHHFGWKMGEPVLQKVAVTGDQYEQFLTGVEIEHSVADMRQNGVLADAAVADKQAILLAYDQPDHQDFWLGFNNFYVITRYNRSPLYAMAVFQLSQHIRQQYEAGLTR